MLGNASTPKFLAVDFYCGAGGTTRGLLDAGGYVIAGIDKDTSCERTYQHNNRNTTLDCAPPDFLALDMFPASNDYPQGQQQEAQEALGELIPRYRRMAAGIPLIFAICAPCQSFTKFVQRRMTNDRVNGRRRDQNLLSQTISFIAEFQPEMLISENVASIKRGKYRRIWEDFQSQLRELGYRVGEGEVCASRFGVPQYRKRSILMACRGNMETDSTFNLPVPNHDPEASSLSVSDAIGNLPPLEAGEACPDIPNHACRNLTDINLMRLMSVKPGESNFGLAESSFGDLSLACHDRLASKGQRGFGDVYTRLRPGRPAPTITTRFHSVSNGRFGHYDENQVRGLSLHEGALLQSFSEEYEFYGSGMDTIAKMIGNAVPPKLSAYMANWLLGIWADSNTSDTKVTSDL